MSDTIQSTKETFVEMKVSIWWMLFRRRWIVKTFMVLFAMGVMLRLGIWQLDRLDQRRIFNARVSAQINQPALDLSNNFWNKDLIIMEYRKVVVEGEYDHSQQVSLRNQVHGNQWGVHLLTPLKITNSDQYVLVDRGWIPAEDFLSNNYEKYNEEGIITVNGILRASKTKPDFGSRSDPVPVPGGERILNWNFPNLAAISKQLPYPILPVYIQVSPDPSWDRLPVRSQPELDLTEGPHLGYAMQWFTFSLIAGVGYVILVNKKLPQNKEFIEGKDVLSMDTYH